MSAISTTGARIDRWDNGRPAHREHARLVEALKLERSSRYLYWAAFITFISEPHDEVPDLILAPYNPSGAACRTRERAHGGQRAGVCHRPLGGSPRHRHHRGEPRSPQSLRTPVAGPSASVRSPPKCPRWQPAAL